MIVQRLSSQAPFEFNSSISYMISKLSDQSCDSFVSKQVKNMITYLAFRGCYLEAVCYTHTHGIKKKSNLLF